MDIKCNQEAEKGRGKKSNWQVGTMWIPLGRKPNVDRTALHANNEGVHKLDSVITKSLGMGETS